MGNQPAQGLKTAKAGEMSGASCMGVPRTSLLESPGCKASPGQIAQGYCYADALMEVSLAFLRRLISLCLEP